MKIYTIIRSVFPHLNFQTWYKKTGWWFIFYFQNRVIYTNQHLSLNNGSFSVMYPHFHMRLYQHSIFQSVFFQTLYLTVCIPRPGFLNLVIFQVGGPFFPCKIASFAIINICYFQMLFSKPDIFPGWGSIFYTQNCAILNDNFFLNSTSFSVIITTFTLENIYHYSVCIPRPTFFNLVIFQVGGPFFLAKSRDLQ